MEKHIIAYCEKINQVPLEDSWIVPLEILEREIPTPYVDPSKSGRSRTKRRRGVGESFPTRKNKCSKCKNIGHKRTTARFEMRHNYCNSEIITHSMEIIKHICSSIAMDVVIYEH
ncbi:hypothetical protein H5410_017067 [Solanum commersonii]|uniref:Uncharacterized protein n=1 Tax=Solanum commersonii TaxID=4109 RepID=A0A9J5ZYV2_SOLCO|nr:hypothetical protein H5410_017067 [Solanum commersonii]